MRNLRWTYGDLRKLEKRALALHVGLIAQINMDLVGKLEHSDPLPRASQA